MTLEVSVFIAVKSSGGVHILCRKRSEKMKLLSVHKPEFIISGWGVFLSTNPTSQNGPTVLLLGLRLLTD